MKKSIFILTLFAFIFTSCDENLETTITDNDVNSVVETVNEYAIINKIFQDIGNNTGDAILNSQNSTEGKIAAKTLVPSPEITVYPMDLTTFPKTITIDYKSGILCKDGVTRKGIVTIVSSNWYGQLNSEHTTTFNNYYHNDYKVEGTHFVQNLGENEEDNLHYSVKIDDGKITSTSGETISYTENSYRTWIAGSETPLNIWDDEYLLEGTQAGTSSKGVTYMLTIEDPLHFILLPRSIKSGIINLDVAAIKGIKLNFSDSTITIFGITYPFDN